MIKKVLLLITVCFVSITQGADGALNTSFFNTAGSLTPPNGGGTTAGIWYLPNSGIYTGNTQALTVALQSGKILVGGFIRLSNVITPCIVRLHANGTIDTSFGTIGFVFINTDLFSGALTIANNTTNLTGVMSLAVDANNKILAGCQLIITSGAIFRFSVLRFTVNGTRDTTFNTVANTAYGGSVPGIWYITGTTTFNNNSSCSSVALQPDGKIVCGGYGGVGSVQHFLILRLTSNGQLDTAGFNASGTVPGMWFRSDASLLAQVAYFNGTTTTGPACLGTKSVVIQNSGRILVGGRFRTTVTARLVMGIVALTSAGVIDTTFNPTGSLTVGGTLPGYFAYLTTAGNFSTGVIRSLVLDAEEKLLVGGSTLFSSTVPFVMRLTKDGALDTTFGGQAAPYGATPGFWIVSRTSVFTGANGYITTLALDAFNKIVVNFTGFISTASKIAVARLTANGTLDTTFKTVSTGNPYGGATPGFWYFSTNNTGTFNGTAHVASDMVVSNNGQLFLACYPSVATAVQRFACVSLVNKAGILQDIVPPFDKETATALITTTTIDQVGKVVFGGYYGDTAYVGRYYVTTATRDNTFSTDGVVSLTSLVSTASINKIIVTPENKYIAAGQSNNYMTTVKINQAGVLDAGFNGTGIVVETISTGTGCAYDLLLNGTALAVAGVTTPYGYDTPTVMHYDSQLGIRNSAVGNNGYQKFTHYELAILYGIQYGAGSVLIGAGAYKK